MHPYGITLRESVFHYAFRILIRTRSDPNRITNLDLCLVHT